MYILKPFLEQEIKNAIFVDENNLGIVNWGDYNEIKRNIIDFINDEEQLEDIISNMKLFINKLEKTDPIDYYERSKNV